MEKQKKFVDELDKKKKDKKKITIYVIIFMAVLAAFFGGFFGAPYIGVLLDQPINMGRVLFYLASTVFICYCAAIFHVVLHEAGHLIFGLITGYQFISFRIFSYIWIKEEGKITRKRFSLAGTGGQCIMSPPPLKEGKIPYLWYNLGGVLANVFVSLLLMFFYYYFKPRGFWGEVLLLTFMVGFILALLNGIPLNNGEVLNDGYNIVAIGRSSLSMYAFWLQLKIMEEMAKKKRLKDLPGDWFISPKEEELDNVMVSTIPVFACNRLLDMKEFKQTKEKIEYLLGGKVKMAGIHKILLKIDLLYLTLILSHNQEEISRIYTKELKKYMKQLHSLLPVMRTEYAYALLSDKDLQKAEKMKERFEKAASKYPYPQEVLGERELMEEAEALYHKREE